MPSSPSVHILVLNWNGLRHLQACLPSLVNTTYDNCHFAVLDNASTDGSQAWVWEHFPQVQLTEFPRNLGFTGANNVGMRAAMDAGADYLALLNNDTRVEPDWMKALVAAAEAEADIAICAAQQHTWDGEREIRFHLIPEWAEAEAVYAPIEHAGAPVPTAFASGCAVLLRCDALRSLGLFDDRYFAYVEDVDLTLRAWIAGYSALLVPEAVVYHRFSASSDSTRKTFWGYRNQLTTLLKLYQPETLCAFAQPILRRWFLTRNRTALRATLAALAMLPETLARRARIQRTRQCADAEFLRLCER